MHVWVVVSNPIVPKPTLRCEDDEPSARAPRPSACVGPQPACASGDDADVAWHDDDAYDLRLLRLFEDLASLPVLFLTFSLHVLFNRTYIISLKGCFYSELFYNCENY